MMFNTFYYVLIVFYVLYVFHYGVGLCRCGRPCQRVLCILDDIRLLGLLNARFDIIGVWGLA